MKKIIIIGASGQARSILDIIERCGEYEVAGVIDQFELVNEENWSYSSLGIEEDLPLLIKKQVVYGVVVAIGDNFTRLKIFSLIKKIYPTLKLVRIIDSKAIISNNVTIKEGTVIFPGAIIGPGTIIGQGCFLNSGAILGHDAVLSDFSSVGPGALISGNCSVGECSYLGVGSVLIEKITIGNNTVVGAGSVVTRSIKLQVVAYGNPAKVRKDRKPEDKYFK